MKKEKLKLILVGCALLIMFIGIIVALNAELNTSTIYDGTSVPTSITTHILVIMIFVVVSDILLLIANKMTAIDGILLKPHLVFHGVYAVTGLFFSIASAYQARANNLSEFYSSMNSAPDWYSDGITSESWFDTLPAYASSFSTLSTVFYVFTVIGVIATVVLLVRILSSKKESNSQDNNSSN